ncbi:ThiF family adenylyltransferase [Corynebacterium mendelii]|uniref:ThiF family adenylyltransferase n=1 Tax=Corynebacterium mendelii TaxID=2765362 RepID=A0A939DZE8_9CORY|nr:ThiF family adenylyltransferase [Corynebacterium mendelii]MBN9643858.1 ThiF family adenylyltransferase [Corynebacterium mendelii]
MGKIQPLVSDARAAAVELSAAEKRRTARQMVLDGFGDMAQKRLAAARVLVVGAGGLGSPCVMSLAAAGLGHVTIAEDDTVDYSNLQRQILYGVDDVGKNKADTARARLLAMASDMTVATPGRMTAARAAEMIAGHDLVIDGCDNFATRYLCADAAEIARVPVVWGAVLRYSGQLAVFGVDGFPVLRDIYPSPPPPDKRPSCAAAGVLGATTAVMGSLMATEAIKLITGIGEPLVGAMLVYDALSARTRIFRVGCDPSRTPVSAPGTGPVVHLGAADFRRFVSAPGHVVIDVRDAAEITPATTVDAAGGRRVQPVADLVAGGLASLDPPLPETTEAICFCCASGVRSAAAAEAVAEEAAGKGIRVFSLDGGITPRP